MNRIWLRGGWMMCHPRRRHINLSKVPGCAFFPHRPHLSPTCEPRPASRITSDWQMTAGSFPAAQLAPHEPLPRTESTDNHKGNKLTSAVNITLLSQTAVSHFTSAVQETVRVTKDRTGRMRPHTFFFCICFTAVTFSPSCCETNQSSFFNGERKDGCQCQMRDYRTQMIPKNAHWLKVLGGGGCPIT